MANFNQSLLEGIHPDDVPLAKILLFTAFEKLRIYDYLQVEDGKVVLSNDLKQSANQIIRQLIDNNSIIADYEGAVRISPMAPLYVDGQIEQTYDVSVIRDCFKSSYLENTYGLSIAGKMGDIKSCERNLNHVIEEYKDLFSRANNDVLRAATEKYVQSCVEQDRFLLDCDNFIWNGKSKLAEFVETVLDEGIREHQIKPGEAQDWTQE